MSRVPISRVPADRVPADRVFARESAPGATTTVRGRRLDAPPPAVPPDRTPGARSGLTALRHVREAGLVHDAANLLGAMGLYLDLLERPGTLQPHHHHYATELRRLAERGGSLLRQLLPEIAGSGLRHAAPPEPSVGRSLPGGKRCTASSPAETLLALTPLLRGLAGPAIELTVEVRSQEDSGTAPTPWPAGMADGHAPGAAGIVDGHAAGVALDAEALERITVNLVLNAVQAMRRQAHSGEAQSGDESQQRVGSKRHPLPRPQITVRLCRAGAALRLVVSDNGPGLSAEVAARLLAPQPAPFGEHGHGHRIVQQTATATGGNVAVRSSAERGTTITVHWPPQVAPPSPLGRASRPQPQQRLQPLKSSAATHPRPLPPPATLYKDPTIAC